MRQRAMAVSRKELRTDTALIVLNEDSSLPEESLYRNWTEVVYDGLTEPFVVPAHWHAGHTELLSVKSGVVEISLDGATRKVTPSDGVVRVPPYHLHGFRMVKGTPAVLVERPDPAAYAPTKQM